MTRPRAARRVRPLLAAVVAAVVAPLLVSCGGSPQEDYCALLEERQPDLTATAEEDGEAALITALPVLRDLADAAPRDVADAWDVVVVRVEDLAAVLEEAGVDPASYSAEEPPADLAEEDRAAIEAAATRLVDRTTLEAVGDVEQHALDVCGRPLGL